MLKVDVTLTASSSSKRIAFISDHIFSIRGTRAVKQNSGKFAIVRDFSRSSFLFSEIGRAYKEDHLNVTVSENYTKAIQDFFASDLPEQPACIKPTLPMLDTQLQFLSFFNSQIIPDGNPIGWRNKYAGVYNASEPGTGKTLSAVAAVNSVYALRVLVVCPANLTFQWESEVKNYLVAPPTTAVIGEMNAKNRAIVLEQLKGVPYLYCFVSYETFRINVDDFASQRWDAAIFDECIKLANKSAAVTERTLRFINPETNPNTPKIAIGLNGTPISTSAANLWTQLFVTRCKGIENYDYETFRDCFTQAKKVMVSEGVWQTRYEGVENAEALATLLGDNYFRIGKNWAILPEKLYRTVGVRMSETEADIYEKIEASSSMIPGKSSKDIAADEARIEKLRKLRDEAFKDGFTDQGFAKYLEAGVTNDDLVEAIRQLAPDTADFSIEGEEFLEQFDEATLAALMRQAKMSRLLRLQRLTGGFERIVEIGGGKSVVKVLDAKVDWTVDFCKSNPTNSIIVFCKFNSEVYEITARLQEQGIFAESITGADAPVDVENKKRAFQNTETQVLVCQIKKMFEGHNLQRCDTMIFFSESFQVVHREQGESRAHRLGRREPVEYITLLLEFPDGSPTIDHYIHENIVNRKRNALSALSINTVKHSADDKLMALAEKLAAQFPSLKDKLTGIMAEHMDGANTSVVVNDEEDFKEDDED